MTIERKFEYLVDWGIVSEDFVEGAICVGGYNDETAERILFYQTGYRTFEQYIGCEFEDEEEEEE